MANQEITAEDHSRKGYTEDILNIAFGPLSNYLMTLESIPGDDLGDNNLNARRTAETLQALYDHGHAACLKGFA